MGRPSLRPTGSTGDGFARLTLQGSIDARQTIALRVTTAAGTRVALLHLRPGQNSPINLDRSPVPSHPGQISSQQVYSSPSSRFGLPVLAVSGDRATVLSYEGDRVDATSTDRYEMRVQVDLGTGAARPGPRRRVSAMRAPTCHR